MIYNLYNRLKLFDTESTNCEWMQRCISCSIQIDTSVTNHAQIFEGVCVGELRAIIKERGQIVSARVAAHHLRLLCTDTVSDSGLLSRAYACSFIKHGQFVVRVVGHEGKLIRKQHVGQQKFWSASERAFHPVCQAVSVVKTYVEQQRGDGTTPIGCLIPIQTKK